MMKLLLMLFFGLLAHEALAQNQSPKFIETIKKEGYFFITDSAFNKSIDGILYQEEYPDHRTYEDKTFQFYWNTLCNDGSYILTITPEQIFFSSGHNNPNRNYLYWVQPIQKPQYGILAAKLKANTPKGFHNYVKQNKKYQFADKEYRENFIIPENWTKEELKKFEMECEKQQQLQLEKYYILLNALLQGKTDKLELPKLIKQKPKLFSSDRNELQEWMPIKK